ncbi:MAG: hypothetical protein WKF30_17420 [Pyrinomonadaceae bacterium]
MADHLAASLGATPAPTMMPFPEAQNVLREQSVYDWVILNRYWPEAEETDQKPDREGGREKRRPPSGWGF